MSKQLTKGQTLYYIHWSKYPTIHECQVASVSANQKEVRISIDLDICKAFSGGSFHTSHILGHKFHFTEASARNKINQEMDDLIKLAESTYLDTVNRANKCRIRPIKKLNK